MDDKDIDEEYGNNLLVASELGKFAELLYFSENPTKEFLAKLAHPNWTIYSNGYASYKFCAKLYNFSDIWNDSHTQKNFRSGLRDQAISLMKSLNCFEVRIPIKNELLFSGLGQNSLRTCFAQLQRDYLEAATDEDFDRSLLKLQILNICKKFDLIDF